jgi:hypothetical protein
MCLEYVSVGKNNENNKRDKREASAEDDDSNSEEGEEDGESSESEGMTEVTLFSKSSSFYMISRWIWLLLTCMVRSWPY